MIRTMNVVIVLLATIFLAFSCSRGEPDKQAPPATPRPSKDPEAAKRLIGEGATVIDVRSADEFQSGHLPDAVNIPVDEVGGRLAEVDKLVAGDKAKPVVVYCAKGGRAAKAKQVLEEAGYERVVNGGGLDDLE
jgi:rhodanese-related sulfurtransferase